MTIGPVTDVDLVDRAVRDLDQTGELVEIHVSLSSFGVLTDGPVTIAEGLRASGTTVRAAALVPDLFSTPALVNDLPAQRRQCTTKTEQE
ncbi:MAG: hypothetical protein JWP32_2522 [Schumannella sp.]|nr:hypothetical protein [Schumannella sp.]